MTNINNFDPDLLIINEIAVFNSRSMKNVTHHMFFLITQLVCLEKVEKKYLIFCKTQKIRKC